MAKITLIGAGSVVFAKRLIGDILQFPALSDSTICLMDIDPDRLKVAKIMAERIVGTLGVKATVQATANRRTAIRGADYVICTIQVGGYKPGTVIDFEIPKKYGLEQTIGDTLGVGGVFRGLRTIPALVDIARDIADVGAPDCQLLNYSNPMAMNCWAVDRATGIPHVGLCHSVQGTSKMLAGYAGIPYEDLRFLVAGINHMAFFLRFEYRGQDAYPLLWKALEDPGRTSELVRFEMMRRTGYFVTESSEHQSEYLPYFIHHGQAVIDRYNIPIDEYLRRCEAIIATWEETEKNLLGSEDTGIAVEPQSHEYGAYIIHARETHQPTVIYGNVPNRGLITNLPDGCCVELPVLVDGNGLQPTVIGDLPPQLAAICRTNTNVQDLTVEAALTGRREHIYHAVMMDPHAGATLTLDQIWALCDDLIEAHQKVGLLGDFSPTMPNSGRSFAGLGDQVLARLKIEDDFDTEPGSINRIYLEVENPGKQPASLDFKLGTEPGVLSVVGKASCKVKVPAGKTVREPLQVKVGKAGIEEAAHLDLTCRQPAVLCTGVVARPRKRFIPDASGVARVKLELAGNEAGIVDLSREKTGLRLKGRIHDSAVEPAEAAHKGSCLEVFLSSLSDGSVRQIILQPEKNKRTIRVTRKGDPGFKPAKQTLRTTPMYYDFDVVLPWKDLPGIEADKPILFDLIGTLQALGDAHSGGRTTLNGTFESWRRSSHYSILLP
ncbi:MAG: alpha-glucosidase/alpha-galactosidase [Opitutales bacterium]